MDDDLYSYLNDCVMCFGNIISFVVLACYSCDSRVNHVAFQGELLYCVYCCIDLVNVCVCSWRR